MTELFRAVTAFLASATARLAAGGPLVYIEHVGAVLHVRSAEPVDEPCALHLHPDEPALTARVMDDDEMYAFGEVVGHHFTDDHDAIGAACRTAMATLALEEAAYGLEDDH